MTHRIEMMLMADEAGLGRVLGVIRRRRFAIREMRAVRPDETSGRLMLDLVISGERPVQTLVKQLAGIPIVREVEASPEAEATTDSAARTPARAHVVVR